MDDKERRRQRIIEIATQIVTSQVAKGEIEDSDEVIKEATLEAVEIAQAAYDAAVEYLCG